MVFFFFLVVQIDGIWHPFFSKEENLFQGNPGTKMLNNMVKYKKKESQLTSHFICTCIWKENHIGPSLALYIYIIMSKIEWTRFDFKNKHIFMCSIESKSLLIASNLHMIPFSLSLSMDEYMSWYITQFFFKERTLFKWIKKWWKKQKRNIQEDYFCFIFLGFKP